MSAAPIHDVQPVHAGDAGALLGREIRIEGHGGAAQVPHVVDATAFHNRAFAHNRNGVGKRFHLGEDVIGEQDCGAARAGIARTVLKFDFRAGVGPARGFVEDEQFRIAR